MTRLAVLAAASLSVLVGSECEAAAQARLYGGPAEALRVVARLGPAWKKPTRRERVRMKGDLRVERYWFGKARFVNLSSDREGIVRNLFLIDDFVPERERHRVRGGRGCVALPAGDRVADILLAALEPLHARIERDRNLVRSVARFGWSANANTLDATVGNSHFRFSYFNGRCQLEAGEVRRTPTA